MSPKEMRYVSNTKPKGNEKESQSRLLMRAREVWVVKYITQEQKYRLKWLKRGKRNKWMNKHPHSKANEGGARRISWGKEEGRKKYEVRKEWNQKRI